MKCLYLATRSLDPTGRGRARWMMRGKPALDALAITFELAVGESVGCQPGYRALGRSEAKVDLLA